MDIESRIGKRGKEMQFDIDAIPPEVNERIIENSKENPDHIAIHETETTSNTQETNTEPLKEESNDKLQETIKKLGEIFPDAVKDGEVDFDKLKAVVDKKEEVLPVILQRKEPVNVPLKDDIERQEPAPVEVVAPIVVVAPKMTERERNAAARQRRREQREAQRRSYEERLAREAAEQEEYARQQERRKIFAIVGAVIVTLLLIYFFGLLGPAVFGLLAGGLLAKK